jgi:KDO2-lipid IV(A) lauroyltransferase
MKTSWFNYWITDPFWGCLDYLTFQTLSCFSLENVSNFGAYIGILAKKRFKKANEDTQANLRYLFPDLSDEERNNIGNKMWRNIARTLTEMSVLDKFNLSENIQQKNLHIFEKLDKKKPVIFLGPHLGNWELLAISIIEQGFKFNVIYEKVPNRLLTKLRKRVGYELISPDYSGTRKIFKALSSGQSIGMATDEFKGERIIAPVFYGQLSDKCNLVYAVGLARRFSTPIVYVYCKREAGVNFTIEYAEPIHLDSQQYIGKTDSDIAQIINQKCKKWILDYPDQWYMLHRARLDNG